MTPITFLLDTNTVSELTKSAPDARCLAWLTANAAQCAISTITLAELRYGVERLTDGKRKAALDRDFAFLLEDYQGRFFEFDGPSATEWGRYAAELEADAGEAWWKHHDFRDTQIAAIAREYGLTVVTRNTRHFKFVPTADPFV
jgi:predicted nucleic acid-binding protein